MTVVTPSMSVMIASPEVYVTEPDVVCTPSIHVPTLDVTISLPATVRETISDHGYQTPAGSTVAPELVGTTKEMLSF